MAITFYQTKKDELRYRATLWKDNRPIRSKSFRRKLDALSWEARQRVQLEDNGVGRLKGEKITLNEFYEQIYWPNKLIRASTAKDYSVLFKRNAETKFGSRKLHSISSDEWAIHFAQLVAKGMSKSRVNRLHAVLSAVYKMAVKFNYAAVNPLQRVDWFEDEICDFDYWNLNEAQKFLTWAFHTQNPRFPLYQTAYETGMRLSELLALQRDCVDIENGILKVRRSFCKVTKEVLTTTKSGKDRILGMNPGLKSTFQKVIEQHDSVFIFTDSRSKPFTHDEITHHFKRDQKSAEIRRISFHSLRHTFASHFVMKGGSIYDLKELLGHSGVETTMRYAHLAPAHLRAQASLVSFSSIVPGNVVALNSSSPKHFPNIGGENASETEPLTSDENLNKVVTSISKSLYADVVKLGPSLAMVMTPDVEN